MTFREESRVIRLNGLATDQRAARLMPETISRRFSIVPLWLEPDRMMVACTDPLDDELIRDAESACRRSLGVFKAGYAEIRDALERCYGNGSHQSARLDLGGILYLSGLISAESLFKARVEQKKSGKTLGSICREEGIINERDYAEALSIYCDVPFFNLKGFDPNSDLAPLLPWELATQRQAIPIWWTDGILVLATPELTPGDHLEDVAKIIGLPIQPVLCCKSDWDRLYRKFYLQGVVDAELIDQQALDLLVGSRRISRDVLQVVQAVSLQTGRGVRDVLVESNFITETEWIEALSASSGIPADLEWVNGHGSNADEENLTRLIPLAIALKFNICPIRLDRSNLHLAMANPDREIIRLARQVSGYEIVPTLCSPKAIENRLEELSRHHTPRKAMLMPKLSELLLKMGIVSETQAGEIRLNERAGFQSMTDGLLREKYLDETGLMEVLALQTSIPHTRLEHTRISKKYLSLIPESLAHDHLILPLWADGEDLWAAIADPFDRVGIKLAEEASGLCLKPILAAPASIQATLDRWLERRQTAATDNRVLTLLQWLVSKGLITQINATAALNTYKLGQVELDEAIVQASLMPRLQITGAIAEFNKLAFVSLQLVEERIQRIDLLGRETDRTIISEPLEVQTVTLLSYEQAKVYSAIPIREDGNRITVGFANPIYQDDLAHIHRLLGREIMPVYVDRQELDEALQRVLGRRNIGTYLLMDGLISRSQLNQALDITRRAGSRLGQALINRGFITQEQLYRYLAKQSNLPLIDLKSVEIDKELASSIPQGLARENGILPIQDSDGKITLAIVDSYNKTGIEQVQKRLGREISLVLVTESDFDDALEKLFSENYLNASTSELLERAPQDSAYRVLSQGQIIALALISLGSLIWSWLDFNSFIIMVNSLATIFYVGFSGYKLFLVYRALAVNMELPVSPEELNSLDERKLPTYTLLIPAFREAEVLPELLGALNQLDYPPTKLDIQVLLEQEDKATIQAYDEWSPPSQFHRVIVPYGIPMTKPKACNYGLIHARGEYVVIYDAEDLPEPDQLKKIVLAFAKAPADIACIQSKLNYFNSEQNILTQWFTVEYSMWFDLFLPGLAASKAPIPLGGTSNHFKRNVLVEIGAWDPYNVTEDADLGIRLFKRGYKTAIVDSTTYEEANSRIYNWLRQRSRWIKGYIQTWLVHMRNPVRLIREIGWKAFLSFHFVVGGTFFAALLNPIYWLLTTLWFLVHWNFIQALYPGVIYFLGALALFIGNFAFTYMNVAGALRRSYYGMVKYALISPLYWGLASIGAWMGLIQLLYKPHFWEKTEHGFHSNGIKAVNPSPEDPTF